MKANIQPPAPRQSGAGTSAVTIFPSKVEAVVSVQPEVYTLDVILRTAHRFMDRCYVHVNQANPTLIEVSFRQRGETDLDVVTGEFCNELLDGTLREIVSRESRAERDLILAHALSRHPVLNSEFETADAFSDPANLLTADSKCTA